MIRITARIQPEFTYDHCEQVLTNTFYLLYSSDSITYVTTDYNPDKYDGIISLDLIENDLLNLGLLCDCISMETII